MYVANISKFSDTYTVNRKKVVTTCGYPTLYPPQPIIIHHHLSSPVIAYNKPIITHHQKKQLTLYVQAATS